MNWTRANVGREGFTCNLQRCQTSGPMNDGQVCKEQFNPSLRSTHPEWESCKNKYASVSFRDGNKASIGEGTPFITQTPSRYNADRMHTCACTHTNAHTHPHTMTLVIYRAGRQRFNGWGPWETWGKGTSLSRHWAGFLANTCSHPLST